MTGIYCIENKINGKRYVGMAKDIASRWRAHRSHLFHGTHPNAHLQFAWDKYGEDAFSFYVLEIVSSHDLKASEMAWIKRLNTFENGYNLTIGGDGQNGRRLTDAERRHLSDINKGARNPNYGLKRSVETRQKLSASMKGRKRGEMSPTHKAAISKGNKGKPRPWNNKPVLWVETGEMFASVTDASQKTGYKIAAISQVCRGVRNALYKQHFKFMEE